MFDVTLIPAQQATTATPTGVHVVVSKLESGRARISDDSKVAV